MVPAPSAQDLIATVLADSPDDAPLTRLQTAASMTKDVSEKADAVLGYFVDQSRRAGHTWSEIGESLGVTKQAAQQRHGARFGPAPSGLEGFTERARGVVASSEFSARYLGHAFVGTEHLLLAQYAEPHGVGAKVLVASGLLADAVRQAILDLVGRGSGPGEGRLPFTPRAVQLLSDASSIALELGHNYVGTEHLLLASARGEGVAAKVLEAAGLSEATLQSKITTELARLRQRPANAKATGPSTQPRSRRRPQPKESKPKS